MNKPTLQNIRYADELYVWKLYDDKKSVNCQPKFTS